MFFGDDAGSLEAVDAQTGKPLWHFNTGQDMSASPMTYSVAGKQYVAIAAGQRRFQFRVALIGVSNFKLKGADI